MENTLYYGDNLKIMREFIPDESVDLIYLDPPFNSKADYNILFREPSGELSEAQITAFEDTWHWNIEIERTFQEIQQIAPKNVVEMMQGFRDNVIGKNDMMAYLTMMCIRLIELRRVLKNTGSIYLHCDPTASHYLKIVLDSIFRKNNFKNEIIWNYGRGASNIKNSLPKGHETIFFYSKGTKNIWSPPIKPYSDKLLKSLKKDKKGFYYTRGQRTGRREIAEWEIKAKVGLKTYVDLEKGGTKCTDLWDDIGGYPRFNESLGYPTQKPIALLERIINASSNEAEVVLDPFCGCGTTIAAAEKLKRKWIGIDITHLAINLMKYRLHDMFGLWAGKDYKVIGEPTVLSAAKQLAGENRYQFQYWALSLIGAIPFQDKKKGADTGIDGYIRFIHEKGKYKHAIVQVKSGHVSVAQIRDLWGVVDREKSEIGIFLTLESPTKPMIDEAAKKGLYHSEVWGRDYPRIQIFTIEDLFAGKKPEYPSSVHQYKRAERVEEKGENNKIEFE